MLLRDQGCLDAVGLGAGLHGTVGVGGGEWITGAHGIEIRPDIPDTMYRDAKPEMVILPGGMPGAKNLDESATVKQALRAADRNGGYLAAICAAPSVLAAFGILQGNAKTDWVRIVFVGIGYFIVYYFLFSFIVSLLVSTFNRSFKMALSVALLIFRGIDRVSSIYSSTTSPNTLYI